jgi:hypothetical protein
VVDGPTDPADPLYWPQAPLGAVIGPNPGPLGPPSVWLVPGLPPVPWPLEPADPSAYNAVPYWTLFTFGSEAYGIRLAFAAALDAAGLARGMVRYGAPALLPNTQYVYRVDPPGGAAPMTTTCTAWRAAVHTTLGSGEEAINVFHLADLGTPYSPDVAGALAVGQVVADAWAAFYHATPPALGAVNALFPSSIRFDEVRVARVTVTAPAPVVNGKPKPVNYDVPTQFVPMAAGLLGTAPNSLPYEVALCLSLGTGQRGKSHRGRTYLGPLATGLMAGTQGLFDAAIVQATAATWWTEFAARLKTGVGGKQLELVVLSQKLATLFPVTGVRVGVVPDSQRRRRRSQQEAYVLAGGVI